MAEWQKFSGLLADRKSFVDPEYGIAKKRIYIKRWLSELYDKKPRRILDIGAGTGSFCHACQEFGHETLAILSAMRTNTGYKKACAYYGVTFIEFTWGSEPSPLEDSSFDVVNSQGMMGDNDAEIWPRMLDDMLRVLKPGGVLVLGANHETGNKYSNIVNGWAEKSEVARVTFHKAQTLWKWKKLGG